MTDQFELFISYSRRDDETGWVTGLRDFILADHRRFSSEPMRIFLDRSEIRTMDDWRHRILGALRSSNVLLVCQSPNYYRSAYCRWEFEEYLRMQARVPVGGDPIAVVYFVEVPGADPTIDQRWREEIARHHHVDLQPWFPRGTEALEDADVAARLARLGEDVWDRLSRTRRAASVRGNVRRPSPTFVGRHAEVRRLHEQVALGQVGVITALHGLGGLGKTELAVAYAHAYADQYRGGAWSVAAEGKTDLLALIGELSTAPELGYARTAADEADLRLAGRNVLAHLERLATDGDGSDGAHALVIVDNVDHPALLAARQVAELPNRDAVRVIATTRLGADRLAARTSLAFVPVDALAPEDALELIRWHQLPRDPEGRHPDFVSQEEEAAAKEIVELLGGFTLAVEQVAVFLGLHPEIAPSRYLGWLRSEGLALPDQHSSDDDVRDALLHQQGLLSVVLSSTLDSVGAPERFALHAAAHLPPDEVPWPWLEAITRERFPELAGAAEGPDPWLGVRRRVEGLRFLTPGEHPATARMHRMVAAHLRATGGDGAAEGAVVGHLAGRAQAVSQHGTIEAWEPAALAHAAVLLTPAHPELARPVGNALQRLARYVVDGSVETLADHHLAHFRALAEAMPGNLDAARDVSVSLNNVARLRQRTDPAAALTLYEESLTIARALAEAMPGNLDAARDVSVSLDNVADLRQRTDPAAALTLYEESLTLRRALAETMPGNLQAQSDLVVSLFRLAALIDETGDPTRSATPLWAEACALMRDLDARGHLPSEWDRFLQIACEKAGR